MFFFLSICLPCAFLLSRWLFQNGRWAAFNQIKMQRLLLHQSIDYLCSLLQWRHSASSITHTHTSCGDPGSSSLCLFMPWNDHWKALLQEGRWRLSCSKMALHFGCSWSGFPLVLHLSHIILVARFDVSEGQSCSKSRLTSVRHHYCPSGMLILISKMIEHLMFMKLMLQAAPSSCWFYWKEVLNPHLHGI